jgi:hypothetical protein
MVSLCQFGMPVWNACNGALITMGQIFYATVYDIDNLICSRTDSNKFHANCYSFSGSVATVHYLLRQKPYRVMWLGNYAVEVIDDFSREEDLYGLSTGFSYEYMEDNIKDLENKSYFSKAKFIADKHNYWNFINVWDEAKKFFDMRNSQTVTYSGYLLNYTQKIAIDLQKYFLKSFCITEKCELYAFDLIPFLTETGGGTTMALCYGMTVDTTDQLIETWCGNLLHIVDYLPSDFNLIDCCFADLYQKAYMYYYMFGVDKDNYVLTNKGGERYTCIDLEAFYYSNMTLSNVIVEKGEHKIKFKIINIK